MPEHRVSAGFALYDSDMKHAYVVLAHTRPDLFAELISALGGRSVTAHVDRKSDQHPFENAARGLDLRFVRRRIDVRWGGFSQIEAILRLLESAPDDADQYTLLSGDSFPIRDQDAIETFLQKNPSALYLDAVPVSPDHPMDAEVRDRFLWAYDERHPQSILWARAKNAGRRSHARRQFGGYAPTGEAHG